MGPGRLPGAWGLAARSPLEAARLLMQLWNIRRGCDYSPWAVRGEEERNKPSPIALTGLGITWFKSW